MNEPGPDWDDIWEGLEPKQPRRSRAGYVLALAAVAFLALGTCALGYYALQARAPAEPGLTLPGEETGSTDENTAEQPVSEATAGNENPSLAPTATLPGSLATQSALPSVADTIAPRAPAAPVIDGDAAGWAGLPVYSSPHIVFAGDTWDGSDDLAVSWQVSWDDIYLYFMANVADDIHAQNQTGNQTFRGDSIELQIDAGRAGGFNPSLSPDDFQINLSPGDFAAIPPSAFRFQGTADGSMLDAAVPHSIIVAAIPSGAGYILEAAIPWSDLGLTPSAGLTIGLAVNVNDNDRPGTATQEMMKSSAPNRRFSDPTTWGTLTLQ